MLTMIDCSRRNATVLASKRRTVLFAVARLRHAALIEHAMISSRQERRSYNGTAPVSLYNFV